MGDFFLLRALIIQKWCGCQRRKEIEVAHPKREKVQ